ncbi:MAG: transketolase family protein [Nanoarchaeota archaeon]|nr:transketolase family protein [Nanoarchaeota archaeon]MBU1029598.1 transketolase family protein [Nanoarchaeota archaeon]MBU1850209.1 transketolase family protein [Nanoarchaeota archaeon]
MTDMKSTREGYGVGLVKLGKKRKDVVVLCADLSDSTKTSLFEKEFPKRFFNVGVAEQNMVSVAVGFALSGKIPFVSSFAAFIPNRALDQIRVSVCYNKANVKLASTHAGLSVGPDGATHQALEDIAVMRVLPNMTVIVPADYNESINAVDAVVKIKGPVYIRLGRDKLPVFTKEEFVIGKANVLRNGSDATIVACGLMVHKALLAAEALSKKGLSIRVINCHTIKPLDEKTILKAAKETGAIVSAEEHQIAGGLGSMISEFLSEKYPVPILKVGVKDSFGESGSSSELLEKFGLTAKDMAKAVKKVLKMKKF